MDKLNFEIYIDMDDTIVATSPSIQNIYKFPNFWIHNAKNTKNPFKLIKSLLLWKHISKNSNFWINLSPKKEYLKLFQATTQLDPHPKILTALPSFFFKDNKNSFQQAKESKSLWVKKYLPDIKNENIFFSRSKNKHIYVSQDINTVSILIDDNPIICSNWNKSGGIALQINANDIEDSVYEIINYLNNIFSNKHLNKPSLINKILIK